MRNSESQIVDGIHGRSLVQHCPVTSTNRVVALDIIRGFALIGILLMNIEWFNRPLAEIGRFDVNLTGLDWAASWFIKVFVEGKFWKLFTLLFGMGFAIMIIKAQESNRAYISLFVRRMMFLFFMGVIHMVFIWSGDILNLYAIGGLMMLAWISIIHTKKFKRFNKPIVFLRIGLVMLIIPVMIPLIGAIYLGLTNDNQDVMKEWQYKQNIIILTDQRLATLVDNNEPILNSKSSFSHQPYIKSSNVSDSEIKAANENLNSDVEVAIKKYNTRKNMSNEEVTAFTQSSYWFATLYRIKVAMVRLKVAPLGTLFIGIPVFFIGYWLIASGIMRKPDQHIVFFKYLTLIGGGFGLFLTITGVMINLHPATDSAFEIKLASQGLFTLGKDVLTAGYLGGLMWLIINNRFKMFFSWLAPMGRMALTNYISHSIILSTLFYGYAGAMFGEVARADQIIIVAIIIINQALISRWWLRHFQFGPLEWLWRSITYLKVQPMIIYKAK